MPRLARPRSRRPGIPRTAGAGSVPGGRPAVDVAHHDPAGPHLSRDDVVINRLRKKLVTAGGLDAEHLIRTEFRRGYLLATDVAALPHQPPAWPRAVLQAAS